MTRRGLAMLVALLCLAHSRAARPAAGETEADAYPPGESVLSGELATPDDLRDAPAALLSPAAFPRPALLPPAGSARAAALSDAKSLGEALREPTHDRAVRVVAARALGDIGGPEVVEDLARGLTDPDPRVRMAAAEAIGRANPPGGEALLELALSKDPSWWVRYAAALALADAGGPSAVESLGRAARADAKPQVRLQATIALGELGGPETAGRLLSPLFDADPGVRVAAGVALGTIGGAQPASLLRTALESEKDPLVRRALLIAVRRAAAPLGLVDEP